LLSHALFISCDPLGCRRRHRHRRQHIDQRLVSFFAEGFSSTDFETTATVEIPFFNCQVFSILFLFIEYQQNFKEF
jgi:hypothetical protein